VGELVIVTGPPGAGKSTVAPLVADGFASSVLVQGDWFFGRWRRGAIDPWLPEAVGQTRIAGAAAAATAGAFSRGDCVVVYEGMIRPYELPGFLATARLTAVHYAVLLPPETTCVARVTTRQGHGFTSVDATRGMYRDFAEAAVPPAHLITDAHPAPQDIAARILDGVAAGSLLWPAAVGPERDQAVGPERDQAAGPERD
jgi:predicted ATPase